ncbi:hypothetical protein KSC_072090 [Ktedonobacter sp. SOSP1-52]|nr:hypothetical protein KSC_072090 [Ktedonobacter sp. SOSP1-52]
MCRKHAIALDHVALAMDPLWFNRIEPRALSWQLKRQNPNALMGLLDGEVVISDPSPHHLADMPRGVVPNEEPMPFSLGCLVLATPVQKLDGDVAHWSPGDKTEPHLLSERIIMASFLPEDPITSKCFRVRIILLPGLLNQTDGMALSTYL